VPKFLLASCTATGTMVLAANFRFGFLAANDSTPNRLGWSGFLSSLSGSADLSQTRKQRGEASG
jgi:hypothetical protein